MSVNNRKVVLVTGASRGIGKRIALEFGRSGWMVVVNFLKEKEKALSVASEIECLGGSARALQADVSDEASVAAMLKDIGQIDVLINNAAVCHDRTILKMTPEEWRSVLATDLEGAFYLLQQCGRAMVRRKEGSIISIASVVGMRGGYGNANYAAAKAGLIALTKTAAREFGRFGVRVNAVLPGFHATDMSGKVPKEYVENVLSESVLHTTTDIDELARFIVLLSQMRTVSGQVFNWDSRIV